MRKIVLTVLPLAALVLVGCQQKPSASKAGEGQGETVLRETLAKGKVAAPAGPQVGVTQIATSGSPRGYGLKLPPPHAEASGRSLTVSLPFRPADGLTWIVGAPGGPWKLTGSKTNAGAGPEGTDLAVFSFQASGPGSGALNFKLNPPKGGADNVMTYQATVVAP